MLGEKRNLRCATELAAHHNECFLEQPARVQVIEQRRYRAIHRRQKMIFQIWKRVAVRVPRLVVAEVHLHQAHPGLHQLRRRKQTPAKRVLSVFFLPLFIRAHHVKSLARLFIGQQIHRHLPVAVKLLHLRRLLEKRPLRI